jgi:hypothetical protein
LPSASCSTARPFAVIEWTVWDGCTPQYGRRLLRRGISIRPCARKRFLEQVAIRQPRTRVKPFLERLNATMGLSRFWIGIFGCRVLVRRRDSERFGRVRLYCPEREARTADATGLALDRIAQKGPQCRPRPPSENSAAGQCEHGEGGATRPRWSSEGGLGRVPINR